MDNATGSHVFCLCVDDYRHETRKQLTHCVACLKSVARTERIRTLKTGARTINDNIRRSTAALAVYLFCLFNTSVWSQQQIQTPEYHLPALAENKTITEADCTAAKLRATIPVSAIGEPVSGVTLNAPVWTNAVNSMPAYCSANGSMAPVDTGATSRPINFRVVLPASWSHRAAQMGGERH
jgi:hypothetical protein